MVLANNGRASIASLTPIKPRLPFAEPPGSRKSW